jgi:hypothetical protein
LRIKISVKHGVSIAEEAAIGSFAERNRDRIGDGGGLITFGYLTTALFTSGLGVSSSVAFGGALAMFGLIKK